MLKTREMLIEERRAKRELEDIELDLFGDEDRSPHLSDNEYLDYLQDQCTTNYSESYI